MVVQMKADRKTREAICMVRAFADQRGNSHDVRTLNDRWASSGCEIRPIEQGSW
jgi:hypothetical protein